MVLLMCAWVIGYLALYLRIVRTEDGRPAWWYVGLLLIALVALVAAVVRSPGRAGLMVAAPLLAFCALVAGFSIGALLLPACLAAIGELVILLRQVNQPVDALPQSEA